MNLVCIHRLYCEDRKKREKFNDLNFEEMHDTDIRCEEI